MSFMRNLFILVFCGGVFAGGGFGKFGVGAELFGAAYGSS